MNKKETKLSSSEESLKRYRNLTITICIGVLFSIISFVAVLSNNINYLKEKFSYESKLKIDNLRNQLNSYQRSLELTKKFFESSAEVTEQEFKEFITPLLQRGHFSNILWSDVSDINDEEFKASFCVTKDGYEHFSKLNPDMSLKNYPNIIKALRNSIETGKPSFSKDANIQPELNNNAAFIYPAVKSKKTIGFVIGVLDLDKILFNNLSTEGNLKHRNIYIYNNDGLIFKQDNAKVYTNTIGKIEDSSDNLIKQSVFYYKENIRLLSNNWQVIFTPTTDYISLAANWYPWTILLLGISLTTILGILFFNLISHNLKKEHAIKMATKELEDNKQHIEAVLNSVMEGIITINTRGIVQTFNPAAEKMFGYERNEIIGKNVRILMPEENAKHHNSYINEYVDTGQAKIIGIGREVEAIRKDGTTFPMGLGITEVELDGERIFVGIVRDITEEKAAKTRLEKAKAHADKANKSKSEFLATMSHEIRTPMNGIIGMAELMSYTELSSQQEKYLQTIKSSGDLLLVLINDILDFSKIEACELELENIPIVINSILSETIQLLSARARENNVELALRVSDDLPLAVWGDPVRLRQILINLLSNSIKFSKDGYALIDVKKVAHEKDLVTLRFEVTDSGIGIPKEKQGHIFDHFAQADSSTTRKFGGTGLGLAICKKLIHLMNGQIGVESEPNKGATFWFEITTQVQTDHIKANKTITKQLQNTNILIIDDYQINLEVYAGYLKKAGLDCNSTTAPEEALSMIEQANKNNTPYDIILVDYKIRKMDGNTIAQTISSNPKDYGRPKLIMITSLDKLPQGHKLDKSIYSAKLLKPIYSSELLDVLLKVLNSSDSLAIETDKKHKTNNGSLPNFNAKVLVAEDFEANKEVIKNILNKLGCQVDVAENGKIATQMAKNQYDIIFMDCQMPIMDGFEATKKIREAKLEKEPIIIALTANALQGDKAKCIEAGMNGYISKPIKIDEIIENIENFYIRDRLTKEDV